MKEHIIVEEDGWFRCTACKKAWRDENKIYPGCLGVPVYPWGAWPDHLLTKKQMSDAGYQTGKKLPAPAGACHREKSPGGIMWLYDSGDGIPKKPISDAQREHLKKIREEARKGWYCARCGDAFGHYRTPGALCNICLDHDEMVAWSRSVLQGDFVILDTETTGLTPDYNEIIEICVMDKSGTKLLDTRIKPQQPERMFEGELRMPRPSPKYTRS
jgi:hypothetical protein